MKKQEKVGILGNHRIQVKCSNLQRNEFHSRVCQKILYSTSFMTFLSFKVYLFFTDLCIMGSLLRKNLHLNGVNEPPHTCGWPLCLVWLLLKQVCFLTIKKISGPCSMITFG